MRITFDLRILRNPQERQRSETALYYLLNSLVAINVDYLRMFPRTSSLYSSGVRYQREDGKEDWRDIPTILLNGCGDCEDLACFRVAELRFRGEKRAAPFIRYHIDDKTGKPVYHVMVKRNGKLEDPSMMLGMQ